MVPEKGVGPLKPSHGWGLDDGVLEANDAVPDWADVMEGLE